ncbi:MAG: 16S rRNA (guanine(966)-N(2))-methyltransferase RsmD [Clostridia bacterium]|nr:16S rRNA (guanine(966)-N(2))-methyltransferase RsmD [Clostridia bacterium]MBQ8720124.1 16S rRNA (guanine(966)-N(2))-methyltransferase RsmD [Clostridia bacterium]
MLKIITGSSKGKKLFTLEGEATRPTSERIKEALFSSIQFDIEGRRVLDLFAGSGSLGLEAMSRGAESVMFIDSSREAIDIVKKNAQNTGFFNSCRYLVSDFRNYIRKAKDREAFDLVFIDPPYAMECCSEAVRKLSEARLLRGGAIVVLESGTEEIRPEELEGFEVLKSTHYGKKTFLNILLYRGESK